MLYMTKNILSLFVCALLLIGLLVYWALTYGSLNGFKRICNEVSERAQSDVGDGAIHQAAAAGVD